MFASRNLYQFLIATINLLLTLPQEHATQEIREYEAGRLNRTSILPIFFLPRSEQNSSLDFEEQFRLIINQREKVEESKLRLVQQLDNFREQYNESLRRTTTAAPPDTSFLLNILKRLRPESINSTSFISKSNNKKKFVDSESDEIILR